ncbi:MAG: hypothetical protein ACTHMC_01960, partial [Pseudobacter sp.]|uniref:hypothetical protein n=1 Tax=Pseudobacter sp. TaxID=2045420 RepID=UPI003F7E0124
QITGIFKSIPLLQFWLKNSYPPSLAVQLYPHCRVAASAKARRKCFLTPGFLFTAVLPIKV